MKKAPKSTSSSVSLGKALIRDRFKSKGQARHSKEDDIAFPPPSATQSNRGTADWAALGSVTEQGDLEEFLMSAELADKEFLAGKPTLKRQMPKSSYPARRSEPTLPAASMTAVSLGNPIWTFYASPEGKPPCRPKWDKDTSTKELHRKEREAFLDWRRKLALFQESSSILLTPYEKNIEMWRQLWRVLEKSHLIVQIVDARSPLLFHCRDLIRYAAEINPSKKNLLLVNKADFLSQEQRAVWAEYFRSVGLDHIFYSAELQMKDVLESQSRLRRGKQEACQASEAAETEMEIEIEMDDRDENQSESKNKDKQENQARRNHETNCGQHKDSANQGAKEAESKDTRIVSRDDLLEIFESYHADYFPECDRLFVGLVGYPNVGKSSTINSIMASKKVAVGPTPGKTKHFQTLILSESLCLVDCPGLVFPNFTSTKAELIVNGILPIDQMREYISPVTLVAQRIPRAVLEGLYGICLPCPSEAEDQTRPPTASELLSAYAALRGYRTTNQGNPDESRASRYILKDYVQGRLLFIHPPPTCSFSERDFNMKNEYKASRLLGLDLAAAEPPRKTNGMSDLDQAFFDERAGHIEAVTTGKAGVKGFLRSALGVGVGAVCGTTIAASGGKKHFKKTKRNPRK